MTDIPYEFICGDTVSTLATRPEIDGINLLISSPPYNIGKAYEQRTPIDAYLDGQKRIIDAFLPRLGPQASLCWQVGTYVRKGEILPLDYLFIPVFQERGLQLRNRIIWTFGSGLHAKTRFSGRHETILWFTMGDEYHYDPAGQFNDPAAAEPEFVDVWDNIVNVKANHPEKTNHPCQYPVGLAERLVLGLTRPDDLVFDPFAGVASTGVAALLHERRFCGIERDPDYHATGLERLEATIDGTIRYRPHDRPIQRPKVGP